MPAVHDRADATPRRPKGPDNTAVKIATGIYRQAKKVATLREVPLAEFLSALLAGPVGREYQREMARLRAEAENEEGRP